MDCQAEWLAYQLLLENVSLILRSQFIDSFKSPRGLSFNFAETARFTSPGFSLSLRDNFQLDADELSSAQRQNGERPLAVEI